MRGIIRLVSDPAPSSELATTLGISIPTCLSLFRINIFLSADYEVYKTLPGFSKESD